MRIGILSDTHDQVKRTARAVAQLAAAGADVLIHCGDYTQRAVVEECAVLPAYFVFGNNDDEIADLTDAMTSVGGTCLGRGGLVEFAGKRIAVTHGDSASEIRRLKSMNPDYLLFGHSHAPSDERDGPIRFINPGALSRATAWTVALLDLDSDLLRLITIRDVR